MCPTRSHSFTLNLGASNQADLCGGPSRPRGWPELTVAWQDSAGCVVGDGSGSWRDPNGCDLPATGDAGQGSRDWPGRTSGSGEGLSEWSLCPPSSYSLSITKAQTYPNPHGPGSGDSGDPGAGYPKLSVSRALQSGGWKATCLHRWIQDQLGL